MILPKSGLGIWRECSRISSQNPKAGMDKIPLLCRTFQNPFWSSFPHRICSKLIGVDQLWSIWGWIPTHGDRFTKSVSVTHNQTEFNSVNHFLQCSGREHTRIPSYEFLDIWNVSRKRGSWGAPESLWRSYCDQECCRSRFRAGNLDFENVRDRSGINLDKQIQFSNWQP